MARKPMRGLDGGSMGVMSSRMASKTTLNCESYFFSISASLRARSLWEANSSRSFTNARMISILTCTARLLFKTLDSMATPCSVKALGSLRVPPQLDVPNWNFKFIASCKSS